MASKEGKRFINLKDVEHARIMCWECREWIEHDKCHYCLAAKPLIIWDPSWEIKFT